MPGPFPTQVDSSPPQYIRHVAHIHNYPKSEEPGIPRLSTISYHSANPPNISGSSSYYSWNNQSHTDSNQVETELPFGSAYDNSSSSSNNQRIPRRSISTDLVQNDINRRLTLQSSPNIVLIDSKILSVSVASVSADPDLIQRNASDPTLLSSHLPLDLINMGKIQEFREKVGVSQVKMPQKDIWRCLGAEFLGTFFLVLIGCGSTLPVAGAEEPTLLGIALCFGLLVATLAEVRFNHFIFHLILHIFKY
jgi:hypothetical protein